MIALAAIAVALICCAFALGVVLTRPSPGNTGPQTVILRPVERPASSPLAGMTSAALDLVAEANARGLR